MKIVKQFFLILLILFISLLIPVRINTQEELSQVKFGLPITFVVQNQVKSPPLPIQVGLAGLYENPTTVLWLPLIINVIIIFFALKIISKTLR